MDIRSFTDKLFAKGREHDFQDMEVYVASRNQFRVGVFKTEIDNYTLAESRGLSFRGIINGGMGYSFTENFDEDSIDILIRDAAENARVIDSGDKEEIFAGSANYVELDSYSIELEKVSAAEKIAWAKELEQAAYALDSRVFTAQVSMGNGSGETLIMNTKGLNLNDKGNFAQGFVSVVVKEGQDTKSAYGFVADRDFTKFKAEKLAKEAVEEALSLLGAEPVESGSYPVVLRNDVAASFLSTFASSFSAEAAQKGLSLLKGKVGEMIMSPSITITDDPHMSGRPGSTPFDAEGVATSSKNVVDAGRLNTLLHNLKTAKKDNVAPTGNAYKGAYNAPVGVAPTNLYINIGDKPYDQLIQEMGSGLIIISIQGTHSGANPVSGDFSLSAYGYVVDNGQVVRPVNQITIAGNLFAMLSDVQAVGNDLDFGTGTIGSPSLLIGSLAVAGK